MARLPIPGSDDGTWGNVLNDYLSQELNPDGSLKRGPELTTTTAKANAAYVKPTGGVPRSDLAADVQTSLAAADAGASGTAPDATTTTKGVVRLAGDLTGTALSPLIAAGAVTGGGGGHIAAGTITDTNIHVSATIAKSKLAPLAIADSDVASNAGIAQSKIAGLTTDLAGKAAAVHAHAISDTTGLQSSLDSKADATATTTALNAKANTSDVNAALAGKEAVVTSGSTSQYYRGDKSWQTLNKASVGLANVDNTSDANKPISTATQSALTGLSNDIATKANTSDVTTGLAAKANTSHTHSSADLTDIQQTITNTIGNKLIAGSNISLNYDAGTGETIISASSGGGGTGSETVTTVAGRTGDVVLVAGDITAGTLATARIPDLSASKITSDTLDIARIPTGTTGTTVALGNHAHSAYAATSHSHAQSDVTGLVTALADKAPTVHAHAIADTTGLQSALDDKASTGDLAGKAAAVHVHAAGDTTTGTFDPARIPNLDAAKINTGTLNVARIPTGTTTGTIALGDHTHSGYSSVAHIHDDRYYTESESDAALALKLNASQKGVANGVATLGADSKIPLAQLPALAINDTFTAGSQAAMLALTAERGDVCIRTDTNKTYILATDSPATLGDWKELVGTGQVASVAGKTGVVTLAKADVGLSNVDNTSDANKPVSAATQTALDAKVGTADARLTDTRVPTDGSVTDAKVAAGAAISADKLAEGTTNKLLTAAERSKLAGIAAGATVNDTDANLRNRANHTGTQPAVTISNFNEQVRDTMGAALVAGTNISITPDDNNDTITIASTGGTASDASIAALINDTSSATALALTNNYLGVNRADDFADAPVEAWKNTDQSITSSASMQNDTQLAVPVEANSAYHITGTLWIDSDTTSDFKCQWLLPAGTTMKWRISSLSIAASTTPGTVNFEALTETGFGRSGGLGVGTQIPVQITGVITTSTESGTARLQWAQNNAQALATTVRSGSWIKRETAMRVASTTPGGNDASQLLNGNVVSINGQVYTAQSPDKAYSLAVAGDPATPTYSRHELRSGDQWKGDLTAGYSSGTGRQRVELNSSDRVPLGVDRWSAWQFRVTGSIPTTYTELGQFFSAKEAGELPDDGKPPPLGFQILDGNFVILTRGDSAASTQTPPPITTRYSQPWTLTGQWVSMVIQTNFHWSTGMLRVWMNGTQIVNVTDIVMAYNDTQGPKFKHGIYRQGSTLTTVAEWANVVYPTTTDLSSRISSPPATPA